MITADQLIKIAPNIKRSAVETFIPHLKVFMPQYEINNKQRIAAFIAQVLWESGEFKYTREIASGNAYEGRKDLGNIYPGDGQKFKGRGLIQLTGRSNYAALSKLWFGDDTLTRNPDLLATPMYATKSACWYWVSRNLNHQADRPADTKIEVTVRGKKLILNPFQYITLRINGGFNHFKFRLAYYEKALKVIT